MEVLGLQRCLTYWHVRRSVDNLLEDDSDTSSDYDLLLTAASSSAIDARSPHGRVDIQRKEPDLVDM